MDIRKLRYFYTIAQEKQITRAAKRLHIAQPPLSQQLKQLEGELGIPLFERNGKKLELTEAGKVLYHRTEKLLHEMDDMITEVKETHEGIRGVLALGSVKSCFSFLPRQLKSFREQYPNLHFHLQEGDTYFLSESLRNREIELAIVRLPIDKDDFSLLRLPSEPYVLVTTKEMCPFPSSISEVFMADLADLPLLLLHRMSGVGQYEVILNACRLNGFEPNIVCECPDVSMLLSLAAANVGAAIVPKSSLSEAAYPNLKALTIIENSVQAEAAMIWLTDRHLSTAAKRFISQLEASLAATET
ncbi:LysR family transcriptional regulator [Pontibacillus salicampi]|uniref:LysR family transcriptional regulator n=1 Tax=Pontibacillus salicampi TaxID=1449801 RepID=A0ABV6LQ41_9BACI